ncbi:MAG: SDR family oxidoreductase [Candidatus Eremiobacteraeota bacterium]|nr:SDR family oxidoreductase [Candidatus Eremiobacteraeota bacterium]
MVDYKRLFDLAGKTALVLGAASGIGKASAEALAGLGARVICADLDEERLRETAAALGAESHRCDAGSAADVAALAQTIASRHPRLDAAVTTPGINIRRALVDYPDDDFDRVIATNLKGAFLFLRAFSRLMIAQGGEGGRSIVACSSIRAVTLEPGLAVYASTKAGIVQLVSGAASEVGAYGIRVNAIAPSIVETALTAPLKEKPEIYETYARHTVLGRWSRPSEIGAAVAFLVSDAASYVTGSTLFVDGGWTAIDGPPTGLTQTRPSEVPG